jgi:hypothetical protein
MVVGLIQRITGLPYMVVGNAVWLASAPALAFSLMTLARRAGLNWPGIAAIIALLAGTFAPWVHGASMIGLPYSQLPLVQSVGGDATPIAAGPSPYLLLAGLGLIVLPKATALDSACGFRRAALAWLCLAAIYPFFLPTLCLTAGFCALLWSTQRGWPKMVSGIGWLIIISAPPMIYWATLPLVDDEYARFAAANWRPLFSPFVVVVSLGLGFGAILGIPRLLRGNPYQQMLACFAAAVLVALYIPAHPWRSHIFYVSPVLVLAALSAWWPVFQQFGRTPRWIFAGGVLIAVSVSIPYYYAENVRGLLNYGPPAYLSSGVVNAIQWIARQPGTDVVLARSDLSPWIAARRSHRVVVGHYLWTKQYRRRFADVKAVFDDGADPLSLLRAEQVAWVIVDEDRGSPLWARGIEPVARFDQTVILRADRLLEHLTARDRIDAP